MHKMHLIFTRYIWILNGESCFGLLYCSSKSFLTVNYNSLFTQIIIIYSYYFLLVKVAVVVEVLQLLLLRIIIQQIIYFQLTLSIASSSVTLTHCMSSFTTSVNLLCGLSTSPCLADPYSVSLPTMSTNPPLHLSKPWLIDFVFKLLKLICASDVLIIRGTHNLGLS